MPHAHGYRARTRHMYSLGFRKHGVINLSTYLKQVKVGDLVDIVANPAIHKGMPHKYYHGRTGTVFNVSPHAIGVEVNKQVRTRVVRKRLHVRIEHVRQSKCRKDFLDRVQRNDDIKREAKANGSAYSASFRVLCGLTGCNAARCGARPLYLGFDWLASSFCVVYPPAVVL